MRALLVASTVLLALAQGQADTQLPIPDVLYPAQLPVTPADSAACWSTGSPASDGGTNFFTVSMCVNKQGWRQSYIQYMNLGTANSASILINSDDHVAHTNFSLAPPVATGNHRGYTWYQYGSDHSIHGFSAPHSDGSNGRVSWKVKQEGEVTKPSYSQHYNLVYAASLNPATNTSDTRAYDLDTGSQMWAHSFTGVYAVSDAVYVEDLSAGSYVFWVVEFSNETLAPSIVKAGAHANSRNYATATNPCQIHPAPGEHFQLARVKFGADMNGDLNGMFMYGNYKPPAGSKFTKSNFVVCHFSHHTMNLEHSWGFSDAYDVYGVTGGDNATIWNVYNRDTKQYEVIILNQTVASAYNRDFIVRRSTDKDNNPVIVYGPDPSYSPRLVMQLTNTSTGDRVVAYDTWAISSGLPAWTRPHGCWLTATVARNWGQDTFFCQDELSSERFATHLDYAGKVIWQQPNVPSAFPIVNVADVFVAAQLNYPLIGYSFSPDLSTPVPPAPVVTPSPTEPGSNNGKGAISGPGTPAPEPGPVNSPKSGGVGAGVVFLILLLVVLVVGGVFGFVFRKPLGRMWVERKHGSRQPINELNNHEGYGDLNA